MGRPEGLVGCAFGCARAHLPATGSGGRSCDIRGRATAGERARTARLCDRPLVGPKLGREREWKQRLEQIREDYRRRPRFMEILDEIEGRTIVGSNKARGNRLRKR